MPRSTVGSRSPLPCLQLLAPAFPVLDKSMAAHNGARIGESAASHLRANERLTLRWGDVWPSRCVAWVVGGQIVKKARSLKTTHQRLHRPTSPHVKVGAGEGI
mmetsp:Transcript_26341/g.79943  ORF Transcript_26341/g.79943 Transcript_26341/m.79943 type:complete len:103 (-) Transcript_26341:791-1099(-)